MGASRRRSDGLLNLRDGNLLAVSGMGQAAAARAAGALADAGVAALVSWGMAGGLDPRLRAGTICVPDDVLSQDGTRFETDLHWREILRAAITSRMTVVGGALLTSSAAIGEGRAKVLAYRETGAAAVDMESVAIAEVSAIRRLPFIAVRAIVDTAADTLPAAVLAAGNDGHIRISRLLGGILRAPRELAPVLRLARRYGAAVRALRAVAGSNALAPMP